MTVLGIRCSRPERAGLVVQPIVEINARSLAKGTSTKVMRFSDLERAIPSITQKMLGQQLKSMEADGIVHRTAYPQVPPKVEYRLIKMGPVSLSSSGWNPQMGRPASEQLRVRASCLIPGDSQSGSAKPHYMSLGRGRLHRTNPAVEAGWLPVSRQLGQFHRASVKLVATNLLRFGS